MQDMVDGPGRTVQPAGPAPLALAVQLGQHLIPEEQPPGPLVEINDPALGYVALDALQVSSVTSFSIFLPICNSLAYKIKLASHFYFNLIGDSVGVPIDLTRI